MALPKEPEVAGGSAPNHSSPEAKHPRRVTADGQPQPKCCTSESVLNSGVGLSQAAKLNPDKEWCKKCARDVFDLNKHRLRLRSAEALD